MNGTAHTTHTAPSRAGKTERAYRWIRERIHNHEFAPGHRLVLSSLAEELGVSVVPVREAIRQLEAEDLVTFERNVGARVAMVDGRSYAETMEVVAYLEEAATALAVPRLTALDLDDAEECNAEMAALLDDLDPRRFTLLNRRFHSILFRRSPNTRLRELLTTEWDRLDHQRESTFAFVPERAPASVAEHTRIVDLIRAGADPAYVGQVARRHRMATLEACLERAPGSHTHQNRRKATS
ncbi:GntR family transcriptional regulator [Corynebacterium bovis]|uniref:GntR family transcriptional regulator n=2 Tax=Corynebacterium bovis TaxID=36808 RepID=A0A426Q9A4_9CORY|nr:GntR family transcriptional regulator [Corynebacterium bovis]MBB3115467.1 DNA-binding GntR family transcriptional regulator [Corynebacterium bovis DSM 20582 = CIP 54.80]MDN8579264.1 GntR family transcriptional regulator [Corynebacterium bovis]QQC46632.1 GntR family transcriptional regulator [Corynebacterium bovis]RRO80325.1 GntR family transcriptional regulator [Corynebacterium bovis]RRO81321.1 GntR family transcriptional regulator [Corynebacterium bovis]